MTKYAGIEANQVDLDALDITVHKVLELGIIAEAGLQMTGHSGSEDFSDLFDSIGVLLRYAAAEMLWEVYKDDPENKDNQTKMDRDYFVKPALVLEVQESIMSMDSFGWGLIERLVK